MVATPHIKEYTKKRNILAKYEYTYSERELKEMVEELEK